MKRLYAACGILLLLLGLSLTNGWYARRLTARTAEELERARALAAQENWDGAAEVTAAVLEEVHISEADTEVPVRQDEGPHH